jgi:hypothetical protein
MDTKAILRILGAIFSLAAMWLFAGCGTVTVSPWWFSHEIASTDHIVVTNRMAGMPSLWPGMPQDPTLNYKLTITGPDAKEIVHAISTMHTEVDLSGQPESATAYEWQLNFYHRKKFLGEVGMSPDLIECGDYEYPAPPELKKLYERIERESGSVPAR